MPAEPFFLTPGLVPAGRTLLRDLYNFATFLLFLVLVFAVGAPLRLLDRVFRIRLLDRLIRIFEMCA